MDLSGMSASTSRYDRIPNRARRDHYTIASCILYLGINVMVWTHAISLVADVALGQKPNSLLGVRTSASAGSGHGRITRDVAEDVARFNEPTAGLRVATVTAGSSATMGM